MSLETWEKEAEQKIKEYIQLLDDGHISEDEYKELVEDLIDLKKINEDLELEENKILAQKIVDGLKLVAGLF